MNFRLDFEKLISNEKFRIGFLIVFAATVFFTKLGLNGMANFDDCFYAEKAKEILQNHDGWILTFNHRPAFENPPFFMWLIALSFKVFGISGFAAKFPSAFMGLLSVLLVYVMGRKLFNPWSGFWAAFILCTTYPFFKYGRHAMMDVTLTFFVLVSFYFLLLALRKNSWFFLLWGFSIGCAVLIKSVLGFFPLVISACFVVGTGSLKKLSNLPFVLGCLICVAWGGSWYGLEYSRFGTEFLSAHFGWLIFQRGFTLEPQPWTKHLSYFLDLLTYYWPWLPLAVLGYAWAVRKKFWKDETLLLLVLWPAIYIAVMSAMNARILWYIMPIFPALALLSGHFLDQHQTEKGRKSVGQIIVAFGLAVVVCANALPFALDKDREKDTRILSPYVKHFAEAGDAIVAFHEDFYGLNNALLFYSDHAADPLFSTAEQVAGELKKDHAVLCVAHRSDLAEIGRLFPAWHPVKFADNLVLISNRNLDLSQVQTGGGPWEN